MIAKSNHLLNVTATVVLLLANIVAFNMIFGRVRAARVDLTEGKIYTLAPETIELVQEPEEPLELFLYYTAPDKMHEKLRPLIVPLGDMLKEIAAASNGHVTTRLVEWDTADKATQDRAAEQFGVRGVPIQMQTASEATVRETYFSLVVAYGDQHQRFDQSDLYRIVQTGAGLDIDVELQNIEYLVAKAIFKVVRGFQSIGAALATNDMQARIDLYFSPKEAMPKFLEKVPEHAAKAAKKLASEGLGRIKVETKIVSDKEEDAGLRRRLLSEGIRPIRVDLFSETGIYCWAVITAGEKTALVPLIGSMGEELSEFDVKEAIEGQLKSLVPGFLTLVGVMTPDAKQNPMAMMSQRQQPPEEFRDTVSALEREFDVRKIDLTEGKPIPRQIAVLVIIRPENYSDQAIYEIDQFLMRGGRLVVCADAYSFDLEKVIQSQTGDPNTIKKVEDETFRKFLRHLGADVGESMILDTRSEIVQYVRRGKRGNAEVVNIKLPYFVDIESPEGFDQKHDIVAKQSFIMLEWATPVTASKAEPAADGKEAKPGLPAGVEAREIAWTSNESSTSTDMARAQSQETHDYKPPADAKRQSVALVLRGVFPSYFAGRPAPGDAKKEPESKGAESAASKPEDRERGVKLDRSKETTVVVIGDSDFASPILPNAFELQGSIWRQNFAFLRNAIDFGGPEARLMAIRNRENVQRPLLGLRKYDEKERLEKAGFSRNLALAIPVAALLFLGVGWWAFRHNRRPLDLPGSRKAS